MSLDDYKWWWWWLLVVVAVVVLVLGDVVVNTMTSFTFGCTVYTVREYVSLLVLIYVVVE